MKKIISFMLAMLMILSMSACAGDLFPAGESESEIIVIPDETDPGDKTDSPAADEQSSIASQLVGNWLQYKYSPLEVEGEMRYFPDGRIEYVRYEESTPSTYTISQSPQGDTLFFTVYQYQDRRTLEMETDKCFYVLTNEIDLTNDYETKEALYRKYEDRYGEDDGEYRYAGVLSISDGILYNGSEVWVKSDRIDRETPVSLEGVWFRYDGSYFVFHSDGTGEEYDHQGSNMQAFFYKYDEQSHQLMLYRYNPDWEEFDSEEDQYEHERNPLTVTGNMMEAACGDCWIKK